ncbi:hypothetical protein, partial [Anaerotignum sp.]|uniref:hypothetical protein n=1 Tax=Anaerotignum sp. TaxID=2039241 RepID=UPI0039A37E89
PYIWRIAFWREIKTKEEREAENETAYWFRFLWIDKGGKADVLNYGILRQQCGFGVISGGL